MQRKRRVMTGDAYGYSHFKMSVPGAHHLTLANLTNRVPLQWEHFQSDDLRYVQSIGGYAFADEVLNDPINHDDVDRMKAIFQSFQVALPDPSKRIPYPFDEARMRRVVDDYGGRFPVAVLAIPPGTTFYVGEPYMLMFSDEPDMAQAAIAYLQARSLPYTFRPTTAATRARRRYDRMYNEVMKRAYPKLAKSDPETLRAMTLALIVDFGMRSCLDSDLTGAAILQTWPGTDTMDAVEAAMFDYNGGKATWACSIPAVEHAVVAGWPCEDDAIDHALQEFRGGFLSWVGDTDGWQEKGIARLTRDDRVKVVRAGEGYLVGRPDSGDYIKDVMMGLQAFGDAFSTTRQEAGLRKIQNAGLIEGDEMSDRKAFAPGELYDTMMKAGWCPTCCAVGMGEYAHRGSRSDSSAKFMIGAVGVLDESGSVSGYRLDMKRGDNIIKLSKPGFFSWHDRDYQRLVPITAQQFMNGDFGDYEVLADYRVRSPRFPMTPRRTFDEIVAITRSSWEDRDPNPVYQSIVDPGVLELQRICLARKVADLPAPEMPIDLQEFELPQDVSAELAQV